MTALKKALVLFLAAVLAAVTASACGGGEEGTTQEQEVAADDNPGEEKGENSVLIAYFSLGNNAQYPDDIDASTSASIVEDGEARYGTTEYVGRMIQEETGGDLYQIQTAEAYPADFDAVVDQNHEEMEEGTLPELVENDLNLDSYDTVFLGYPIWAAHVPQAIFAFLEFYDLSGKQILPFCTHDGYGEGNSYEAIAEAVPEAQVLDGLAIEASNIQEASSEVSQWLSQSGIKAQEDGTDLKITIGDTELEGVFYDTELAGEFRARFPLTVSMGGFGGREYYGGIEFTPESAERGQLHFENRDITYCEQNQTMAIFYAQTDQPNLTMEVIPIGRVTSDLAVFEELPEEIEVTFDN